MTPVKILTRKTIFKGFFGVDELEVQFGDDPTLVKRNMVTTSEACGVLVHNMDADTIIFSKQYRLGAIDQANPYVIEMPAGLVDKNETLEACAHREVKEETGHGITSIEKIGAFFTSPGYTNEKINLFYGITTQKHKLAAGGGLKDEHEFIEIIEIPFNKALEMVESGEICDAKTVLALFWLQKKMLKL